MSIFSSIFRKSSCENDDTIEDLSFVIDAVIDVSLESGSIVGEFFFYLLSMTGKILRFRCHRKIEYGIYTHFVVVVRIKLWKVWILLIGLKRK